MSGLILHLIIDEKEVLNDIDKALKEIVFRNLFNKGIYWNGNTLNKELLIINTNSHLNIILLVDKINNGYKFTVKTVMRRLDFKTNKNTFILNIQ